MTNWRRLTVTWYQLDGLPCHGTRFIGLRLLSIMLRRAPIGLLNWKLHNFKNVQNRTNWIRRGWNKWHSLSRILSNFNCHIAVIVVIYESTQSLIVLLDESSDSRIVVSRFTSVPWFERNMASLSAESWSSIIMFCDAEQEMNSTRKRTAIKYTWRVIEVKQTYGSNFLCLLGNPTSCSSSMFSNFLDIQC